MDIDSDDVTDEVVFSVEDGDEVAHCTTPFDDYTSDYAMVLAGV